MKKYTMQERIIAGLVALGFQRDTNTRVTTAIVFKRNEDTFYYVGKGGSLRFGSRRDASVPMRRARIDQIVSAGNLALAGGERAATEAVAPVQAARRQRNILRRRFQ